MPVGEETVRTLLLTSLNAAKKDQPWPRVLEVRDAVDELRLWLSDDRQWGSQTRGRHWQSLIDDVVASLHALGDAAKRHLAVDAAIRELGECKVPFNADKAPTDAALRRRLSRAVDSITERATVVEALTAAWEDLERSALAGREDEPAGRHFLSLAAWLGHDTDSFVMRLTPHLTGTGEIRAAGAWHPPDPTKTQTLDERFEAIRTFLAELPWRTRTIIWLRYRLAKVDWPDSGTPTIEIGEHVRIFDGNWLRGCMAHPRGDHNLPPETVDRGMWMLRSFCGLRDSDDGEVHVVVEDPPESPTAFIRFVLEDEIVGHAVDIARSNAEAIAALGTLHGMAPEIWRLDESHVGIAGDNQGGSSSPPSVEQPTWDERRAVLEDTTSQIIRDLADQLAGHIPIRDPELERAATLLGWLRGARSSPAPLRLVLCDRVIEAVCGWAGIARPDAFVREHLIPWWAYMRIRHVVSNAALMLFWDHPARRAGTEAADQVEWDEIVACGPLELRLEPRPTISLRGIVSEAEWLLERVPEGSDVAKALREVRERTTTGPAADSWWQENCEHARQLERRRQRTRNALMHGGPQAPATVENVIAYAERIAIDALYASLDGKLRGHNLIDHFLDREKQLADTRTRLADGAAPAEVLFVD